MGKAMRRAKIAIAVVIGLSVGRGALGEEIRYLGWNAQQRKAVIETSAGARSVSLGEWVSRFGTVVDVDESRVVLRLELTEAERADRQRRGLLGYAAKELEVVREDLRFQGISIAPGASNP
jgi:hypothetical protein